MRQQLREATRGDHDRLEQRLRLPNSVSHLPEYRALLERFYGFYAPLEPLLFERPEWKALDFHVNARPKTPLLTRDLLYLGLAPRDVEALPRADALPDVRSFARAVGCLYVLEGSTLGGQVLMRHFAKALDVRRGTGAAFFDCYGSETAAMWKTFVDFLERCSNVFEPAPCTDAACETFRLLEHWLVAERRHH